MVNYVKVTNRKTFQNKIFPELNSQKHTPSPIIWFLWNCGIAQNLSFKKKRNRAILREMTIANNYANCCFFAQIWCAKKEKFCVSFRINCTKVLRMETLIERWDWRTWLQICQPEKFRISWKVKKIPGLTSCLLYFQTSFLIPSSSLE